MTRPINTASIEKATGISWDDWLKFFAGINAKDLPHNEIATKAYEHIESLGVFDKGEEGRQNPSG